MATLKRPGPTLLQGCFLTLIFCVAVTANNICGQATVYTPRTREIWIVIEESDWDYTPKGRNLIKDSSLADNVFAESTDDRIGSVYKKARYVEYTSGWKKRISKPKNLKHTGNLGPVIRGVVGDTINVHVLNRGSQNYSVHGHGVKFAKEHEGFFHNDGNGEFPGDVLEPGQDHTYIWEVAARSGPARNDFSSVLWAYHSHVAVPADINTGLVGPIVIVDPKYITNEKEADEAMPCDVDVEVFAYFSVSDENLSKLLEENLKKIPNHKELSSEDMEALLEDDDFVESNLMHIINGFLYGNMPEVTMRVGQRVRWYLSSFGTEVDLHSVAWHGHTVETSLGKRAASVFLSPSAFEVVDMIPDVPGKWIVECHTHDHLDAGMQHFYTVLENLVVTVSTLMGTVEASLLALASWKQLELQHNPLIVVVGIGAQQSVKTLARLKYRSYGWGMLVLVERTGGGWWSDLLQYLGKREPSLFMPRR